MTEMPGRSNARSGFTLVEIMIVACIIGLLAVIAIPAFLKARNTSRINAIANDLRTFGGAFEMYAMEKGGMPGEMEGPHFMAEGVGINEYLRRASFTNSPSFQGGYDWDGPPPHAFYGISVRPWQVTADMCQELDDLMDDGDVNTGSMRWMYGGARYVYMVQE